MAATAFGAVVFIALVGYLSTPAQAPGLPEKDSPKPPSDEDDAVDSGEYYTTDNAVDPEEEYDPLVELRYLAYQAVLEHLDEDRGNAFTQSLRLNLLEHSTEPETDVHRLLLWPILLTSTQAARDELLEELRTEVGNNVYELAGITSADLPEFEGANLEGHLNGMRELAHERTIPRHPIPGGIISFDMYGKSPSEYRTFEGHVGVDFTRGAGTGAIHAAISGTVTRTGGLVTNIINYIETRDGFGVRVQIVDFDGRNFIYAHLREESGESVTFRHEYRTYTQRATNEAGQRYIRELRRRVRIQDGSQFVEIGDFVLAGKHIGEKGNTGNSDGAHLHFEVQELVDGVNTSIDPRAAGNNGLPASLHR